MAALIYAGGAGEVAVAGQAQGADPGLYQAAAAVQVVGQAVVDRLIQHQGGVVGDVAAAEGPGMTAQGTAIDQRAAAIGVEAAEGEFAAAVLGQAAAAADVVAPGVAGIEATLAGVQVDADIAVEGAVAVGRGHQIEPAVAIGLVDDCIARRQLGAGQNVAALTGGEIRKARFQQDLGVDRHHQRQVGRADGGEAVGQAGGVQRLVLGMLGLPIGGRIYPVHAVVDVAATLLGEVDLGLGEGIAAQLGVVDQVVDGEIGGGDAPADHVQRRVHAGDDAVVAQLRGAEQFLAQALGHGIAEADPGEIGGVGVATGKAAVALRRGAEGRAQR